MLCMLCHKSFQFCTPTIYFWWWRMKMVNWIYAAFIFFILRHRFWTELSRRVVAEPPQQIQCLLRMIFNLFHSLKFSGYLETDSPQPPCLSTAVKSMIQMLRLIKPEKLIYTHYDHEHALNKQGGVKNSLCLVFGQNLSLLTFKDFFRLHDWISPA